MRSITLTVLALLPLAGFPACHSPAAAYPAEVGTPRVAAGPWRAWLDSPGGELPFGLELAPGPAHLRAVIANGEERIEVPVVRRDGEELTLELPHYDSRIVARLDGSGRRLEGEWWKRRGPDREARMRFAAEAGAGPRFRPFGTVGPSGPGAGFTGRWRVRFSSSDDPAVAVFAVSPDGTAEGTFLTTTGDYRYLAGVAHGDQLRLSVFDGAHAFLFHARRLAGGGLAGDFWSADSWHETWTAVRDAGARLPDAFEETRWTGRTSLADVRLPDLSGRERSLDDPAFAGRARIIHVFGSWCPNCHDSAELLVELDRRYRGRGLSIVGVGCELTGDLARDTEQVRRYAERHGITYPLLVAAGFADKKAATERLGLVDYVKSFPTTIFLHGDGRVRAVHSGFAGPATGREHDELRRKLTALVEELLAE